DAAYRLAFGRAARPGERAAALGFLREQAQRVDPKEASRAVPSLLRASIPACQGQAAVLSPDGPQRRLDVPHRGPLVTGDFTVEATFLLRSVLAGEGVRTIVAKWDGDVETAGWSFGV